MSEIVQQHPEGAPSERQAFAAWQVETRIKECVRTIRTGWIRLAKDLHQFAEKEMWRDLGHPTFEAWLASPEIDLGRRQVYYLLDVWRELVVKRGVAPAAFERLEVSKVQEVMPAIRRGFVDVEEALSDVEQLARQDLRDRYSGVGTTSTPGRVDTSSGFDATREPAYAICPTCGSRYQRRAA